MTSLRTLYKKTSTGKIQQWDISVEGNIIITKHGQKGGKIQTTRDIIKAGKNVGKVNETTKEEQAQLEAKSKWEKKKKKGYVEKISDASEGKVNEEFVEGGYNPTLAKSFDKDKRHIKYPVASQPKLDGSRCCAHKGKLWSRTRKTIISVPHIEKAFRKVEKYFPMLDGELYNHKYKNDFEKLMHIIRQQKTPDPEHELIEYHVYDIPSDKPYKQRMMDLAKLKKLLGKDSPIKIVPTKVCNSESELMDYYDKCLENGYEGSMARNLDAPYEYKRSFHLQKIKQFDDAEFKIIGMEEGRGKLIGHCAAFVCVTREGNEFKAKMKGKTDMLKEYWDYKEMYIGKTLTVQYQGLTNKTNVPRFPVGLRFREDE